MKFVDEPNSTLAYVTPVESTLTINMNSFKNISEYDVNGIDDNAPFYFDRVLAHELTHAIMAAKIDCFYDLPSFIVEGMAELTHGIDDVRRWDIITLAENPAILEEYLNLDKYSSDSDWDFSAGYIFLPYLAKQAATDATVPVDDTFNGEFDVTINGDAGNDIITNVGDSVKIYGGTGNDSIWSYASDITLEGGAGDDSIITQHINNLIRGGKGNDAITMNGAIFEYADGDNDDTITGDGVINITKGTIDASLVSGNDVILRIGDGSIQIKNGMSDIFLTYGDYSEFWRDKRIENYEGNENTIISGGSNADSVRNRASNVTIKAGAGRDTILNENWNGSVWNAPTPDKVLMKGEDRDDVIHNDDGVNATINGGSGNDKILNVCSTVTINGGNGNDIIDNTDAMSNSFDNVLFEYKTGAGNDIIYGFNETSTLSIGKGTGTYSTKTSGSDIVVTVGKGKITLEGAASLEKVNINSDIILTNASKSPVTIGSAIKTVNAASRTKAIKVTGNALSNTIQGVSKNDTLYDGNGNDSILGNAGNDKLYGQNGNDSLNGGKGNDSLWGGTGNDSLWGDSGKDTFIYSAGEGKDVIYGFADNDLLKITGAFSATYSKSKDEVYFKVDSTAKAITLSDFSATSFNVNGDIYKINGSKLIKK